MLLAAGADAWPPELITRVFRLMYLAAMLPSTVYYSSSSSMLDAMAVSRKAN